METLENLSDILESILFAAGNPVPVALIANFAGYSIGCCALALFA